MNFSKRNPLLRKNANEFNNIIGSLGEEIDDQDLGNIDGGSTPACVSAATAVASVIGGASKWVNDKVTANKKCGGVYTATVECGTKVCGWF